jgi:hypothetical protein
VRVVNTGSEGWAATGTAAVSLAYHLFSSSGDPWRPFSPFSSWVVAFGQGVVPLPHSLLPGKGEIVNTTLQAPVKPGAYRVAWDLQQGASLWFSQEGVLPRAETLHVIEPGQMPVAPTTTPTAQPPPQEDLQYVVDTSIPDGTVMRTRFSFVKGWLVFNDGQSSWTNGWVLRLVSGKPFGAKVIDVPPTRACRSVTILAPMRSPGRPGQYRSVWRMQDPQGRSFGEPLTLVVTVQGGGPKPTPSATAIPLPTPRPRIAGATPTPTPVG